MKHDIGIYISAFWMTVSTTLKLFPKYEHMHKHKNMLSFSGQQKPVKKKEIKGHNKHKLHYNYKDMMSDHHLRVSWYEFNTVFITVVIVDRDKPVSLLHEEIWHSADELLER